MSDTELNAHPDISLYMDNRIAPVNRASAEAHLASCRRCQASLSYFKELRADLKNLPRPALPPGFKTRMLARAGQRRGERSTIRWPWVFSVSGLTGLTVLGLVLISTHDLRKNAYLPAARPVFVNVGNRTAASKPALMETRAQKRILLGTLKDQVAERQNSYVAPAPPTLMSKSFGGIRVSDLPFQLKESSVRGQLFELTGPASARRILHQVLPKYPDRFKELSLQGSVRIYFTLDASGKVHPNVRLVKSSGFADLDQSAMAALRQWKFSPNAHTTEVWGIVTFHTELSR